jgi:threonine/homoserine/homoserine lactone efflux protein
VAFSFAFCPTLFLLFFGFLVPLSASSQGGLFFPGIFAFGATLPLHILAVAAVVGSGGLGNLAQRLRRADAWIRRAIGIVFLLAGANEIFLYWILD